MSYAVSPGKQKAVRTSNNNPTGQGYNRIQNSEERDEESGGSDLEQIKKQIEGNLSQIQLSIRKLEKLNTSISTENDNRKLRDDIKTTLHQATGKIAQTTSLIKQFDEQGSSRASQSMRSKEQSRRFTEQSKAFSETQQNLTTKLKDIGQRIKTKQEMEQQEYMRQSQSMISEHNDSQSIDDQNKYLLQQQKYVLSDDDLKMQADADFVGNMIQQRKEDINMIGDIMANINEMAHAIKDEVDGQGQKLEKLNENMGAADENVEKGLDQLKQARSHQKGASCCLKFLVCVICLAVIIIAAVLYFVVFKK